jgi:hypothetical protein
MGACGQIRQVDRRPVGQDVTVCFIPMEDRTRDLIIRFGSDRAGDFRREQQRHEFG